MARTRACVLCVSASINVFFLLYVFYAADSDSADYGAGVYLVVNNASYAAVDEKRNIRCNDKDPNFRITQRGRFFVLNNYVQSSVKFKCGQSITFATHSDFTYLENLIPIAERWNGPVSVALHAPGTDFDRTVQAVMHLRRCGPRTIREHVTFHVYFEDERLPREVPQPQELNRVKTDCRESSPPYGAEHRKNSYRYLNGISYPVNVGRNIARENAMTHYLLASDIELFPNPGVIDKFLRMVDMPSENDGHGARPKVYPLPVFELKSDSKLPQNKTELVQMVRNGNAQLFHKTICPSCHRFPFFKKWLRKEEDGGLNVFHVAKRLDAYADWEPIYIGTNSEPLYEERLTWEGKRDKMIQGYVMCVLDYEFHILDNAFLTHKPGIKKVENNFLREYIVRKTLAKVYNTIYPEMRILYGQKEGCHI